MALWKKAWETYILLNIDLSPDDGLQSVYSVAGNAIGRIKHRVSSSDHDNVSIFICMGLPGHYLGTMPACLRVLRNRNTVQIITRRYITRLQH